MIDSGALPAGWSLVPLGELLTAIDSGKSFKCEERPPEAHEVGVIKVSAVSWGEYQESESKTCVDAERIEPDYFVRPGDFLFSRANTIELVGACVIAGRVSKRLMLSDKILRLHFAMEDLKPWVLQYLRSKAGRDQIEMLASGNQESMRNIGQERLRQILVPLPPSNERESIGFKLDELLSQLAAASSELSAAKRKVSLYRQSLMKSAVEGTLTADWRRGQHKELASQIAGPDVPAWLTPGWQWLRVDQLPGVNMSNGRSVPTAANGAKVLRLTAVRAGRIDLDEYKLGAWSYSEAQPFAVREGDLLVVRGNGSLSLVGRGGVVPTVTEQVAYPDTLIRVRCDIQTVRPRWLACVWDSELVRSHLERRARTSAGIYKISQPDIASATLPLPPLDEQDEALALLDTELSRVDSIEQSLVLAARAAAAQRQNILRAAFSGQLVPQDPSDEPASALLDRIRAQSQAAAPAVKRKPGRPAKVTA